MRFRVDRFLWRQEVQLELDRLGLSWDYDLFCLDSNNPEHQYAIEVLGRFIKDSLIELLRATYRPKAQLYVWEVDLFLETLKTAHGFIVSYPDSPHYDRIIILRMKAVKALSRRGVGFNFDDEYRDSEGIRLEEALYELIDLCNGNTICENDFNAIRALMDEVCEFTECYSDSPHCGKLVVLREEAITALSNSGVAFDSDWEHVIGNEIRYVSLGNQSRGKYNDAQRIEDPLVCYAWGYNEDVYETEPIRAEDIVQYSDNRPDEIVDEILVKEHVHKMVDSLPENLRNIIDLHYGFYSPACTLNKAGVAFNISLQAARMRESNALKRLSLLVTDEDANWVGVKPHKRAALARLRKSALSRIMTCKAGERKRKSDAIKLKSIAKEANIPLAQVLYKYKQGIPIDKISRAYTFAPLPVLHRLVLFRNKWVLSVNELLGVIGCGEQTLAEVMERNGLRVKWSRQNTINGLERLISKVTDVDFEKKVADVGVAKKEYMADCYNPPDECLECSVRDKNKNRRVRLRTIVDRLGVCQDDLRMMLPRNIKLGENAIEDRLAAWIAVRIAARIYDWAKDPLELKWLPECKKQE